MADLAALRTFLGLGPKELPKFIRVEIPFTTTLFSVDFDVIKDAQNAVFSTLQAIWVENYNNPNRLLIDLPGSSQRIIVSGSSCGMFPVIASGAQKFRVSLEAAPATSLTIPLILLNVPQPYFTYTPF